MCVCERESVDEWLFRPGPAQNLKYIVVQSSNSVTLWSCSRRRLEEIRVKEKHSCGQKRLWCFQVKADAETKQQQHVAEDVTKTEEWSSLPHGTHLHTFFYNHPLIFTWPPLVTVRHLVWYTAFFLCGHYWHSPCGMVSSSFTEVRCPTLAVNVHLAIWRWDRWRAGLFLWPSWFTSKHLYRA